MIMKKYFVLFLFTLIGLTPTYNHVKAQINSGLLDKMTNYTQILNKNTNTNSAILTGSEMDKYIGGLIGIILSFAGVIFLVLIIVAGYTWMTAQGVEEKITKAKQLLTSGIVGAVISFGSFILINAVVYPLYERFYTPTEITSAGSGGEQTVIACSVNEQCADQATRKMCINNNCLECESNDQGFESTACRNMYNNDKPSCDTQNFVCVPNPTMDCSVLSKNTCLTQNKCRWENGRSGSSDRCVNKPEYGCQDQCQGNKPFCLREATPPICVECSEDSDCANNWLDKKCSITTGNFICVPF